MQLLVRDIDKGILERIPLDYRRKDRNRGKYRLDYRKHDPEEDRQCSGSVYHRCILKLYRGSLNERFAQDHVERTDRSGQDVNPEGIRQMQV